FPDGSSLTFYRDLDKTCASIASLNARDAEQYHRFVTLWGKFNEPVYATFLAPPRMDAMLGSIVRRKWSQLRSFMGLGKSADLLKAIFGSYIQLIDTWFEDERLKAALAWFAAQSGTGPDEPGGGEMLAWQILGHQTGVWRPRGGSGMLSQALAGCLEYHGGAVRVSAPVAEIVTSGGRATGVRLASGEVIHARCVISNAHVQTTLLDLIGADKLDPTLVHQLRHLRIADGMGMTIRCAADALPNYAALPMQDGQPNASHQGMQLICPSVDYLRRAYHESQLGRPASAPAILGMTPTSTDPSLAPAGKHIFNVWAQWHPYTLEDGLDWDDIRQREAEKLLRIMDDYAPGFTSQITGTYIKTPVDLERIGGLVRGNLMHIDMTLDQMFMFRPLPDLANYATPIDGLWLTGASTHPGGGVSGAPGYITAHEVLRHWKKMR
ncbi:MAG TPA: NAD(P)/FAD-dependent oxidoreductase, partial [Ktedonobacterales bacterium]|nr:NAD(P)/FAD-dependent oxidoreductase [Ktedonobacterales bacterium]